MEILEAKIPTTPTKLITCTGEGNGGNGCGSILRITKEDLFQTHSSFMGRYETKYATVLCPVCAELTDLASTDKPPAEVQLGTVTVSIDSLPRPRMADIRDVQTRVKQGLGYEAPKEQWARWVGPNGPGPWFLTSCQEAPTDLPASPEFLSPGVKPPLGC